MDMKFCKDCKHYGVNLKIQPSVVCARDGVVVCRVTGEMSAKVGLNPYSERAPWATAAEGWLACGPEGKFFEPKE